MEIITKLIIIILAIKFLKIFKNKLIILLTIELIFLTIIMENLIINNQNNIVLFMIRITMFMVLDRTIGVTFLISRRRSSIWIRKQIKNF